MKSIQFKKIGQYSGNDSEITKLLGGCISYSVNYGSKAVAITYEKDGIEQPIVFGDWIVERNNGEVIVLSNTEFSHLASLYNIANHKNMGDMVRNAVDKAVCFKIRQFWATK